jgi:hypothetical protein
MLNTYLTRTRQLLQNPSSASTQLYADADLTGWINIARGQLAGEAECIRVLGTISTVIGQRPYNFSGINTGVVATTGVQGVIHVRSLRYNVASGSQWVAPRPWEWFEFFYLNNPVPTPGPPFNWSQYAQGSAPPPSASGASGSFYLDPPPDLVYALNCDCVCYPQALAVDGDVEAIPYLWTDAVPYFAAYLALLSSQTNARVADAERMFSYYQVFTNRARQFSNPSVLRGIYQQSVDQTSINKLGLQKSASGG